MKVVKNTVEVMKFIIATWCVLSLLRYGITNNTDSGGIDNPSVEVEYKGRQSNAILTTQVESTFENIWRISVDTLVSNLPHKRYCHSPWLILGKEERVP